GAFFDAFAFDGLAFRLGPGVRLAAVFLVDGFEALLAMFSHTPVQRLSRGDQRDALTPLAPWNNSLRLARWRRETAQPS
ncbi:MAG: hypothetical protein AAGA56_30920, partial [Myxococcota bacterium]